MKNKLVAVAIFSFLGIISSARPADAEEIKQISDLPKVDLKTTKAFDYPTNRPIVAVDNFLGRGKLAVVDVSLDADFLGLHKKGLFSFWSVDKVGFLYCVKDYPEEDCVSLSRQEAYVKVDGKVFALEIEQGSYKISPELREAIQQTTQTIWVRVGSVRDREIGRNTLNSLQEVYAYVRANSCADQNALCMMPFAGKR